MLNDLISGFRLSKENKRDSENPKLKTISIYCILNGARKISSNCPWQSLFQQELDAISKIIEGIIHKPLPATQAIPYICQEYVEKKRSQLRQTQQPNVSVNTLNSKASMSMLVRFIINQKGTRGRKQEIHMAMTNYSTEVVPRVFITTM